MDLSDNTHPGIAGIVVHPSGFNVVLRDGSTFFIDVGVVHKGFGLLRRINGPDWGNPDEWADRDTNAFMHGYPVVDYRDTERGDRAVWDRIRK